MAVEGRAYARERFGGGWGLCLGLTGLEKALGAVGGGLRLNGTEGAQACPPPLVSEGWGPHLGAQQAPCARVGGANALGSSPALLRGPLLPASPDLPSLRGADPVWPPLLLPPQFPHVLPVHLGVPPISLGVRVPHPQPAGTLVVERR